MSMVLGVDSDIVVASDSDYVGNTGYPPLVRSVGSYNAFLRMERKFLG